MPTLQKLSGESGSRAQVHVEARRRGHPRALIRRVQDHVRSETARVAPRGRRGERPRRGARFQGRLALRQVRLPERLVRRRLRADGRDARQPHGHGVDVVDVGRERSGREPGAAPGVLRSQRGLTATRRERERENEPPQVGGPTNVVRCAHPRPEVLGKPTICAPKSRKLIDAWRARGARPVTGTAGRATRGVWEDLYRHAFEPARAKHAPSSNAEDSELTFAPEIDEHSRAIVRERQVVAAVLETLARDSEQRDADAARRARAAAEAAYAAALARTPADGSAAPAEPAPVSTHERLYAEAAAKRATIEFHDDPAKSGRSVRPRGTTRPSRRRRSAAPRSVGDGRRDSSDYPRGGPRPGPRTVRGGAATPLPFVSPNSGRPGDARAPWNRARAGTRSRPTSARQNYDARATRERAPRPRSGRWTSASRRRGWAKRRSPLTRSNPRSRRGARWRRGPRVPCTRLCINPELGRRRCGRRTRNAYRGSNGARTSRRRRGNSWRSDAEAPTRRPGARCSPRRAGERRRSRRRRTRRAPRTCETTTRWRRRTPG